MNEDLFMGAPIKPVPFTVAKARPRVSGRLFQWHEIHPMGRCSLRLLKVVLSHISKTGRYGAPGFVVRLEKTSGAEAPRDFWGPLFRGLKAPAPSGFGGSSLRIKSVGLCGAAIG